LRNTVRLGLVCGCALALGSTAVAETLGDAIAAAYDRNPVLVQQRYLQRARDEGYVQTRSNYGPQINLQGSGGYTARRNSGNTINSNGGELRATVTQPLYTSGRLRGALAASRADVLTGQEQLRQVEQETLQNVIAVYAGVLRDQARVQVAREALIVLRGQLAQNDARQQRGDVTLTDVAQSRSRALAAEQQLAVLEASLATSRAVYLQVVGHNPGMLEPLPRLAALPASVDGAFAEAERSSPQLRAARLQEESSGAAAASVRGERGPTVSLTGEGTYTNRLIQFDGRDGTRELFGGVTITQPLFAAGAIRSRIRQADAQNLADQAGIDIARRQVMQTVAQSWNDLASARTAIFTGQAQVEAAQQAFAGMSCEELNGLRSTLDTLNTQRDLQNAQDLLLQYRYRFYVAHAGLLAATGTLSAQDIVANLAVYDADANFKAVRYSGATPFELVAKELDRIGSAGLRRPQSPALKGQGVPVVDRVVAMPAEPGAALLNAPLAGRGNRALRLSDGRLAQCPLGPR
jgi:outer membrane protein